MNRRPGSNLRRLAPALLLGITAWAGLAHAAPDDGIERAADRLHSDLPLYDFSYTEFWPRHFTEADGSFGCSSRVPFGDWRLTAADAEDRIWRFTNYGVFHCAMVFREGDDLADLEERQSHYEYGFVARIGTARRAGRDVELWTLQRGTVPGSDYILLSRAAEPGRIQQFTVLQRRCPPGRTRKLKSGQNLDIWGTRYCAINSRGELLALAREMASLPPLGELHLLPAQ